MASNADLRLVYTLEEAAEALHVDAPYLERLLLQGLIQYWTVERTNEAGNVESELRFSGPYIRRMKNSHNVRAFIERHA